MKDITEFLKECRVNGNEKIDINDDSFWKLKDLLEHYKEQCNIPVVGSSSIDRKQAEFLWELLDDIDTAGDMFKPRDLDSWERYYSWINKKLRKRFEVFQSDGYKLMTPEEYQESNEKRTKEMLDAFKRQPLRFNSSE